MMSNNSDMLLQLAIVSPADVAATKFIAIEGSVSKAGNLANKHEFARLFSQSLHKQTQFQHGIVKKYPAKKPGKCGERNFVKNNRLSEPAQRSGIKQNHSANSHFSKLAPQHTTHIDRTGADQRTNDIHFTHPAKPALAGKTPVNKSYMLTSSLQTPSAYAQNTWFDEVGHRIMCLLHKDLQQALVYLNPKYLGPLEIRIAMSADRQIDVNFLTHSAALKDTLDQTMPRLRDAFDQTDLNLNDVNVQQQGRDQYNAHPQPFYGTSYLAENMHEDISAAQTTHSLALSSHIVDIYA